jgi:hypothetical protein
MTTKTRFTGLGLALALTALAIPASASAQATRTWVSGVGDDVNPCSRTAPCKTFSGAISKTAAGGIIMAMDDGGFGTLTITKPMTVDGGRGHSAGMLATGGISGVLVNIDPAVQPANFVSNGKVVLKNLKIEGNTSIPSAGGFTPGGIGVRILNAKNVNLYNVDIGFFSRSGVSVEPAASQQSTVVVKNSEIHSNGGAGVMAAPANNGVARLQVRNNEIDDNACGVVATQFGLSNVFATDCGTNAPGASVGFPAINAINNGIADSATSSALVNGSGATVRIGRNVITGSLGPALSAINGGSLLTWNNNEVAGNPGGNGATTGSITPLKRRAKHRH